MAEMVDSQSLRSLLSYTLIGNLCMQRLGMELIITASVLLAPIGLAGGAIAAKYLPELNQICISQNMIRAIVLEDNDEKQVLI